MKVIILMLTLVTTLFAGKERDGTFPYVKSANNIKVVCQDLLDLLPLMKHPLLTEKNKEIIQNGIMALKDQMDDILQHSLKPIAENPRDLDYDKSQQTIVAYKGYLDSIKRVSISRTENVGTYYTVRKDIMHEASHLIGVEGDDEGKFVDEITVDEVKTEWNPHGQGYDSTIKFSDNGWFFSESNFLKEVEMYEQQKVASPSTYRMIFYVYSSGSVLKSEIYLTSNPADPLVLQGSSIWTGTPIAEACKNIVPFPSSANVRLNGDKTAALSLRVINPYIQGSCELMAGTGGTFSFTLVR